MKSPRMLFRLSAVVLMVAFAVFAWAADTPAVSKPPAAASKQPRLVVLLVIDQFRYDYLTRFLGDYTGGFKTLWNNGAVFTNAHLQHFPTVTAVGHSTLLSGATPSRSGIVNNDWFDRASGRTVASIFDPGVTLLGAVKGNGVSPARFLVSTVGDEMKMAGKGPSKVVGISLKDRAAVLPAGHMADGAYWFDTNNGNMISSTFYFPDLPAWVKDFNAKRQVDKYAGSEWKSSKGETLATLPTQTGPEYYSAFEKSPFADEMLLNFAEQAIVSENLGADDAPDLLSVSLSTNDLLGHNVGPDSKELRELHLSNDRQVGQFLQYLTKRFAPGSVLVVFTADHGVSPLPELQKQRKMPGGRVMEPELRKLVEAALTAKYGEAKWVDYASSGSFWISRAAIRDKRLRQSDVEDTAAEALSQADGVYRVYTATQVEHGQLVMDRPGQLVANGFYPGRSADVFCLLAPYYIYGARGASHGAVYSYDTHLPLIFYGAGIRPGKYHQAVAINDIAPTLSEILEVETPSGSVGRVLYEILR